MLFFLLIKVKMPTIVGILTFISMKIPCSAELSMKIFITLGPGIRMLTAILRIQSLFIYESKFCNYFFDLLLCYISKNVTGSDPIRPMIRTKPERRRKYAVLNTQCVHV